MSDTLLKGLDDLYVIRQLHHADKKLKSLFPNYTIKLTTNYIAHLMDAAWDNLSTSDMDHCRNTISDSGTGFCWYRHGYVLPNKPQISVPHECFIECIPDPQVRAALLEAIAYIELQKL